MITFNKKKDFLTLKLVNKDYAPFKSKEIDLDNGQTYVDVSNNTLLLCLESNDREEIYKTFEEFVKTNQVSLNVSFAHIENHFKNFSREDLILIFILNAGVWSQMSYNKKTKLPKEVQYNFDLEKDADVRKYLHIADAMNFTRKLQDTPPTEMNSVALAHHVVSELSNDKSLKIKTLELQDIEGLNMGLLLAVNRGSAYQPRVVVIEYMGNPKSKEKIGLIGKGVTFDTGGYSLKPSSSMTGMKYDMSGAAVIAGTMKAIGNLRPKTNVVAVLGMTDNYINEKAVVIDDVMISMSGKSVEMKNTDAEGRLVMADCMTYAIKEAKATKVVDVATLTGAALVALGTTYTGIWTTKDEDWIKIKEAANEGIENVWRMPFHKDFTKLMRSSTVADIVNSSPIRWGGANTAAAFMNEFAEGLPHIHCDIAPTAEKDGKYGIPVLIRTLINYTFFV